MKLVKMNGPDRGQEVQLTPPFISIGREKDNDIVLLENGISRYHSKIEKDGDIWVVNDLDSSNGVFLNGRKIDKSAPLSINDEIKIYSVSFKIIGDSDSAASISFDKDDDKKIIEKRDENKKKAEKSKKRVLFLTGALVFIMVIVVGLIFLQGQPKAPIKDPDEAAAKKKLPLEVFFRVEHFGKLDENGEFKEDAELNTFVKEFRIKNNKAYFRTHNFLEGDRFEDSKSKDIDMDISVIKNLINTIKDKSFLDAKSPVSNPTDKSHKRIVVQAQVGNIGNYLVYHNQPHGNLLSVMSKINDVIVELFPAISMSRKKREEMFKETVSEAEDYMARKEADSTNRYNALKLYKFAISLYENDNQRPEGYLSVEKDYFALDTEFKGLLEELKNKASLAEKSEPTRALDLYEEIKNLFPAKELPINASDKQKNDPLLSYGFNARVKIFDLKKK